MTERAERLSIKQHTGSCDGHVESKWRPDICLTVRFYVPTASMQCLLILTIQCELNYLKIHLLCIRLSLPADKRTVDVILFFRRSIHITHTRTHVTHSHLHTKLSYFTTAHIQSKHYCRATDLLARTHSDSDSETITC